MQVFRETSEERKHVTLLPPVLVFLDSKGAIESIHHLKPLWVFASEYVGSKLADSALDPDNVDIEALNQLQSLQRRSSALKFDQSPPGIPTPTRFSRMVASSPSGNVNSVIIRNFFQQSVLPEIRDLGGTVDTKGIILTDRHGSHEDQEFLINLEEKQNVKMAFGPPHATDRLQLQDARNGQFQVLKTQSRKDTVLWHKLVRDRDMELRQEDAPFVFQNAYRK